MQQLGPPFFARQSVVGHWGCFFPFIFLLAYQRVFLSRAGVRLQRSLCGVGWLWPSRRHQPLRRSSGAASPLSALPEEDTRHTTQSINQPSSFSSRIHALFIFSSIQFSICLESTSDDVSALTAGSAALLASERCVRCSVRRVAIEGLPYPEAPRNSGRAASSSRSQTSFWHPACNIHRAGACLFIIRITTTYWSSGVAR